MRKRISRPTSEVIQEKLGIKLVSFSEIVTFVTFLETSLK